MNTFEIMLSKSAVKCAAKESTRYAICGVRIDAHDGQARLQVTDGRCGVVLRATTKGGEVRPCTLPAEALAGPAGVRIVEINVPDAPTESEPGRWIAKRVKRGGVVAETRMGDLLSAPFPALTDLLPDSVVAEPDWGDVGARIIRALGIDGDESMESELREIVNEIQAWGTNREQGVRWFSLNPKLLASMAETLGDDERSSVCIGVPAKHTKPLLVEGAKGVGLLMPVQRFGHDVGMSMPEFARRLRDIWADWIGWDGLGIKCGRKPEPVAEPERVDTDAGGVAAMAG